MSGDRRKHIEIIGGAFIIALITTLLARWFLAGSLLEFFQARLESPEIALNAATVIFGALVFGFFALCAYFYRGNTTSKHAQAGAITDDDEAMYDDDQIRVRLSKGMLFLSAVSVCDQVFIATSKVQQVKCTEVDVYSVNGDAHIEVHVRVENPALLQEKHAELCAAIQEMADRLRIRLATEPIIYAKLPPLHGARTLEHESLNSFRAFFSRRSNAPLARPSLFSSRSEQSHTSPPSTLDGEAPPRPFGSIFGRLPRPPKPQKPDDEK